MNNVSQYLNHILQLCPYPRKDDNDVCIHLVALYFDNVLQSLSNGNNQPLPRTLLQITPLDMSTEEFE